MPTIATPRGETITALIKDETTFGTLPSGNWTQTVLYSHGLKQAQPFQDDPVLGGPRTNDRDTTTPATGLPNLSGPIVVPLDFNHIGIWLKGAFGAATDTGSGDPYTHVFKSGNEVIPSRSMEVGVKNVGGSPVYMTYSGLYVSKLSLDLERAAGTQQVSCDLMGRQELKNASTSGGSPSAAWATDVAAKAIGVFQIASVTVADITKVSLAYDNKLIARPDVGDAGGYPLNYEFDGEATCTGSITLRFRATTLYDDAVAASSFAGSMLFSKSSNRSLTILGNAMRLERDGVPITGPGGIVQTFNFRCEQSVSAEMLTVTLKSLVPAY